VQKIKLSFIKEVSGMLKKEDDNQSLRTFSKINSETQKAESNKTKDMPWF
jgi:hypothetical protein